MKAKLVCAFLIGICLFATLSIWIPNVKAQNLPYAELYPSEGSVNTNIYLQIRHLEAYCPYPNWGDYGGSSLYLFWDHTCLMQNVSNNYPASKGIGYDLNFSPPENHPYSVLGSHNVTTQIEYWGDHTFNLTFNIIEYVEPPEYIALNATYYQLLADYDTLNSSFQNLIVQYNTLNSSYNSLLNQYDSLLRNYNSLLSSYDSLASDYNDINSTYGALKASYQSLNSTYYNLNTRYQNLCLTSNQLQTSFNELSGSYNSLNSIHNSLTLNYAQLQGNYTLLVSSYSDLQTKYNNDITYALIITTVVFLATAVYFAKRKPKTQ